MDSIGLRRAISALLLLLAFPVGAATPPAEPYCKRLAFDEEVPPGLTGNYEILGKDGGSAGAYAGTLRIVAVDGRYVVTRTVEGRSVKGEAWVESCSPDEFQVLRVRYAAKPKAIELACYPRFDGDNFTRASCTSMDGRGLEAWFQSHDPS